MARPRLLDLGCCGGGCSWGYYLAGFDVTGVDIEPQPRYPFPFIQADALTVPLDGYDAYHASMPCQGYSTLNAYNHVSYPDLVAPIRERLDATGKPYVIENVLRAPLKAPVRLCGPMFELEIYRDRGFECSGFPVRQPEHARHTELCARNGYLPTAERPFMSIHGGKHSRAWQRAAAIRMGVPWLIAGSGAEALRDGIREVCESIPPAYTEYVGRQLLSALEAATQ